MIRCWGKKFRGHKGLSLPEVMVAAVIGLIALGAILSCFLSGRFASTGAKHWTQAMNIARARIEDLKSIRYADLSTMPGVTLEPNLVLDGLDSGNSIRCTRFTTLTPSDDGITIAVLVSWYERTAGASSTPLSYQLRTWVSSPGSPIVSGS